MLSPQQQVELFQALSQSLSLSQTLSSAKALLAEWIPADGVYSNIYLKDEHQIQVLASVDERGALDRTDRIPIPEEFQHFPTTQDEPVYRVDNIYDDPFTFFAGRQIAPTIQSYVLMKASLDNRHWGVVIFWSSKPQAFTDESVKALEAIRSILSLNVGVAVNDRLATVTQQLKAREETLVKALAQKEEAPLLQLIEKTPSMEELAHDIRRVAPFDATVLITGESGTGKEVLSTVIHQLSPRRHRPFVKVNCSAISPSLIEAELFGWERGAFTDARERHMGLFEQAEGGTLLLDEIGELSLDLQVKLLRVLQQKTFRRLGSDRELQTDVRIIAATNRDLVKEVEEGRFRVDLFYRLNVYPLHIKPLRERPEDLEPLAKLFLAQMSKRYGIHPAPMLGPNALTQLRNWPWPGNVRELQNVITRAVLMGGALIDELPLSQEGPTFAMEGESMAEPMPLDAATLERLEWEHLDFEGVQREYFSRLLARCHGKISGPHGVAERAKLHPNTLRSRLLKLGLLT